MSNLLNPAYRTANHCHLPALLLVEIINVDSFLTCHEIGIEIFYDSFYVATTIGVYDDLVASL